MAEYIIAPDINFYPRTASEEGRGRGASRPRVLAGALNTVQGYQRVLIFGLLSLVAIALSLLAFLAYVYALRDQSVMTDRDVAAWKLTVAFLTQFAVAAAAVVFLRLARWLRS